MFKKPFSLFKSDESKALDLISKVNDDVVKPLAEDALKIATSDEAKNLEITAITALVLDIDKSIPSATATVIATNVVNALDGLGIKLEEKLESKK